MGNALDGYGKPVFDDTFNLPGDLTAAVEYADEFANVRVGTSAERQSLPAGKQRFGMLWVETDTSVVYVTNGSSVWTRVAEPALPFMPLQLSSGWKANDFGYPPAFQVLQTETVLRGSVKRNTGDMSAGQIVSVLPVAARPSAVCYFLGQGAALSVVPLQINPNGEIVVKSTPSVATAWVSLDNTRISR